MSRPVQINDYVHFGKDSSTFIIDNITLQGIKISSLDRNLHFTLVQKDSRWVLTEVAQVTEPHFISREDMPPLLFTNIPELDIKILDELDDFTLEDACSINAYLNSLCLSEQLWRNRILNFYPNVPIFKKEDQSWKDYYRTFRDNPFIQFHYFVESLDPNPVSPREGSNGPDLQFSMKILDKTDNVYKLEINIIQILDSRRREDNEWKGEVYYNSSTGEIRGNLPGTYSYFKRGISEEADDLPIDEAIVVMFGPEEIYDSEKMYWGPTEI